MFKPTITFYRSDERGSRPWCSKIVRGERSRKSRQLIVLISVDYLRSGLDAQVSDLTPSFLPLLVNNPPGLEVYAARPANSLGGMFPSALWGLTSL